jgi:hypothetical protein
LITHQTQVVSARCHHDHIEIALKSLGLLVDAQGPGAAAGRELEVLSRRPEVVVDEVGPGVGVSRAGPMGPAAEGRAHALASADACGEAVTDGGPPLNEAEINL